MYPILEPAVHSMGAPTGDVQYGFLNSFYRSLPNPDPSFFWLKSILALRFHHASPIIDQEGPKQPLGTLAQPLSAQESSRTRQMRVYQRLGHWPSLRFGMVSQNARPWLIDLEAFSQNFTLFFSTLQPDSQHRVQHQGRHGRHMPPSSSQNSLSQVVVVVVYSRTIQDLYAAFAALRKCPVGAMII